MYSLNGTVFQVLCYIDATGYNDNITALEDEVTVFTYYPLNEICAGFFFGGLDVMLALEDTLAIQSLYAKTQVLMKLVVGATEIWACFRLRCVFSTSLK